MSAIFRPHVIFRPRANLRKMQDIILGGLRVEPGITVRHGAFRPAAERSAGIQIQAVAAYLMCSSPQSNGRTRRLSSSVHRRC